MLTSKLVLVLALFCCTAFSTYFTEQTYTLNDCYSLEDAVTMGLCIIANDGTLTPELVSVLLENEIEFFKDINDESDLKDSWGCDLPFTHVSSCSSKGACCDVHDACYAKNGCTASSWYNPSASSACKACNSAVVHCFTFENPGPSVCCAQGNCGQPR